MGLTRDEAALVAKQTTREVGEGLKSGDNDRVVEAVDALYTIDPDAAKDLTGLIIAHRLRNR